MPGLLIGFFNGAANFSNTFPIDIFDLFACQFVKIFVFELDRNIQSPLGVAPTMTISTPRFPEFKEASTQGGKRHIEIVEISHRILRFDARRTFDKTNTVIMGIGIKVIIQFDASTMRLKCLTSTNCNAL